MTSKTFFNRLASGLLSSLPRSLARRTGVAAPGALQPKGNQFDTRTIADLQRDQFSGIRANDLFNRFEFWILGRIERTVGYQEMMLNPDILNKTYCSVFGLDAVQFDEKTQADVERIRELKRQVQEAERKA